MAENLAYDAPGSKCYNNASKYCQKYGRLYNWETAKKVCPPGWHLPSKAEWLELVNFAGGKMTEKTRSLSKKEWRELLDIKGHCRVVGKKLKAKNGWKPKYLIISSNGTDEFGFAALPGGNGGSLDYFSDVGNSGN
jgi:uncharacterized protein (TIGR02145 family)